MASSGHAAPGSSVPSTSRRRTVAAPVFTSTDRSTEQGSMPLHQRTTAYAAPSRVPTRRPDGDTRVSGPPPGCGTTQVGLNGGITRPSPSPGPLMGTSGATPGEDDPPVAGGDEEVGAVVVVAAWPQPAARRASRRRLVIVFMPL